VMTEMLTDILSRAAGLSELRREVTVTMDTDDLCMGAERVVAVADDLRQWADASTDERAAIERYRAVAVVRELANEQWALAARSMRARMSGSM
jgi:predicted Fe-S protein YdhL (DUF1289 family)